MKFRIRYKGVSYGEWITDKGTALDEAVSVQVYARRPCE